MGRLWCHLLAYPTLRAERDDFEAIVVFRRLHKEDTRDAARIARSDPSRSVEVIERVAALDARSGDALMTGLLDVCNSWPLQARAAMVELGCAWSNGNVRLAALRVLADTDPDDAVRRAAADPSAKVRDHAAGFQRLPISLAEPASQQSLFA